MTAATIDLTPTWAGLMPALILALTHGTGEGRRMAAEELERLARSVDSANARARARAEAKPPTMAKLRAADQKAEALAMARACLGAYPAAELEGAKSGKDWLRVATDLRDTLAGLVASLEEGAGQ